jgi:RNA polymerase sigma-70 factor (ECF subfamily)
MHHSDQHTPSDSCEELVRLIAQAQRRLYAFVLTLVRRPADVEDILQETNVVLWRKRDTYRPGSDFFAWAFEIARLQVLAFRARQVRREDPFDDSLLENLADTARQESAMYGRRETALRACLEKLPAEQRALIVRRYQPDVAVHSLAAEIGKTAKAVSEALRRIRENLRQCIERTLAAEFHS